MALFLVGKTIWPSQQAVGSLVGGQWPDSRRWDINLYVSVVSLPVRVVFRSPPYAI